MEGVGAVISIWTACGTFSLTAGFDFCERVALLTHRAMLLTGQSAACNLLMSHFQIFSDRSEVGTKKVPENRYQWKTLKMSRVELI